jgi:hypothetical protein
MPPAGRHVLQPMFVERRGLPLIVRVEVMPLSDIPFQCGCIGVEFFRKKTEAFAVN